jgi:DNA polymerase III subunit delta
LKFDQIIKDLENKIFSPVYFFYGEEPYYIDQLTSFIEKNALDESVKEFNQVVVYGRDIEPHELIDLTRRFPMLGNYQVVIVKEAQDLKNLEELEVYLDSPMETTILVISYKHKKIDKRKGFYKKLAKSKDVVVFESQRIRDYEIPRWIEKTILESGYKIDPYAAGILSEHLGNDLSKINNELKKLMINIESGKEITKIDVEQNIGISKDFNIFEFQNALWQRNALKAQRIVNYFEANPKENPLQMISVMMHNFFMKVYLCHNIRNLEDNKIAAELGIVPYFVKDYRQAARVFSQQKLRSIISQIKTLDLKSKGIGSNDAQNYGELKELVYKIMH